MGESPGKHQVSDATTQVAIVGNIPVMHNQQQCLKNFVVFNSLICIWLVLCNNTHYQQE